MYLLYKDVKCPAKNLAFRKSLEKCCRYQNAVNRNLHLLELSPKDWLTLRLVFLYCWCSKNWNLAIKCIHSLLMLQLTNPSTLPIPTVPPNRRKGDEPRLTKCLLWMRHFTYIASFDPRNNLKVLLSSSNSWENKALTKTKNEEFTNW